jgi:hypothetical protein
VVVVNGRTIKIGALTYTITECEEPRGSDDEKILGDISYSSERIRIEKNIPSRVKQVVLWHEIIHGILEHAGREQDEQLVQVIGYGVSQALADNPWVAALFLEEQIGKLQEVVEKAKPLRDAWTMLFGQSV